MRATSSSVARQLSPVTFCPSGRAGRHAPDLLGIFFNCSIGRKPTDARRIQYGGAPPRFAVTPAYICFPLRRAIGFEVCRNHEVVMISEDIDQLSIATLFIVRE